jgi:energy-coupling factor transporter ATP-binding protein EcfA2
MERGRGSCAQSQHHILISLLLNSAGEESGQCNSYNIIDEHVLFAVIRYGRMACKNLMPFASVPFFVNFTEPDFRLMIAWLTAALRTVGPYPVLVLNGEQASGKSTLARILRLLIDPQAGPALALPKSTRDLMATALNCWLLVYENISTIADWLSDCVCQLAFGGGFASRTLFTNDERTVIYAQRPVILVGIDDFVARGDLRDRSVFLNLNPIARSRRRTESSIWPAFRADYPRMMGGVLDAIAGGLRELPSVQLNDLPRMADYAVWGEATGRALSWGAETFLSTYNDNRRHASAAILDDSPLATVLLSMARHGVAWSGSPAELYRSASEIAGKSTGPHWPKTVNAFGAELRRLAPQIRLHGLSIHFERKHEGRIVTLTSGGD